MMTFSSKYPSASWLWLTLAMVFIDQATKYWVSSSMNLYQSIDVMPFFNITYVLNKGAAFSFLADQGGWQRWFFTAIASVASVVFLVWLLKTPKSNRLLCAAVALMLSGAVGNLVDRVILGHVVDFLDFYIGTKHWPAFNIADSAIFVGAVSMIIDSFKQQSSEQKSINQQQDEQ